MVETCYSHCFTLHSCCICVYMYVCTDHMLHVYSTSADLYLYSYEYILVQHFFFSALVVLTSLGGYTMAPSAVDPATLLWAVTGTALCSASANSFNQWMEVAYDSLMTRTKNRVLVRKMIR